MKRANKFNLKTLYNVLIVVALVAVVVTLIVINNNNSKLELNDEYFVSNDSKYVVAMDADFSNYETSEYEPPVTYMIYYITGDRVSDIKLFYEYLDEEEAKTAYENISMDDKDWASGKSLNGKYVILQFKEDEFNGITAEEAKIYSGQ